jgi:hypothetical protein
MYDYLLRFDTDSDRAAAYPQPEGNPVCWMIDALTVIPVTVWMADPASDTVDEEGRAIRGRVAATGYWLGIATTGQMTDRHPATIVEMARPNSPTPWVDCILFSAFAEMPPVISVDPTFAGSAYVFD